MPPDPQTSTQLNELASDPELLGDFILESREHLTSVELHLLALDHDARNPEAVNAIFRGFHTIKGLAGFLGLPAIQEVAHEVETVLDLARNGQISITPAHIDVILASKDYLNLWLAELAAMQSSGKAPSVTDSAGLLASVRALGKGGAAEKETAIDPVPPALASLSEAAGARDQPAEPPHPPEPESRASEARSIKVDTGKLDFLIDMVGEMVIAQSLVKHDPDLVLAGKQRLARNLAQLARISGDVQRTAMSMRMIPIRQLFQKMTRLVRDLSRKTGKQVELELLGEETELDRNVVEELADPLMHMVRNSIDHGVEPPEERVLTGKAVKARVLLKAGHQAGHIFVEVTDDGRGLDTEKILRKARQRGLVEEGARLSESEIFNLIFQPGFSTAEQVTSVSGRGVGMDVVKKQIEKLRGKVEIHSTLGQGATFVLKVPLTLAIIDGLLVAVGSERYIVPIFAVREMLKPTAEMIATVENREEMVLVRGSLLPVVRLHRQFAVRPRSDSLSDSLLIITEGARGKCFALVVDALIGKQEVVIKSLGDALHDIPGVAGGAILGDGRVGLILDPEALFGRAAA
jgi:two-component system, chemotaxis family, sensor kinase CheA